MRINDNGKLYVKSKIAKIHKVFEVYFNENTGK